MGHRQTSLRNWMGSLIWYSWITGKICTSRIYNLSNSGSLSGQGHRSGETTSGKILALRSTWTMCATAVITIPRNRPATIEYTSVPDAVKYQFMRRKRNTALIPVHQALDANPGYRQTVMLQ